MPDYPELFVLRHGQTDWNAQGRYQGRRDSPLTDLGREQAARQGRILADAGLRARGVPGFASPIGRAWDTAGIALAALGDRPRADDRLVEVSFGLWEGLTGAEIDDNWPGHRDGADGFGWHFGAPEGEDFPSMRDRVRQFLDDLDGPAVVVTHGITSKVLRGLWLGLDQAGMGALPGGQGVVYHLKDGQQRQLPGGPGPMPAGHG